MRDIRWFDDDEDEPEPEPDEDDSIEPEPVVVPPALTKPRARFQRLFVAYLAIFGTAVAACVLDPVDMAPRDAVSALRLLLALLAAPFLLWFVKALVVDLWVQTGQLVRSLLQQRTRGARRPGVWDPWIDDNGWTGGTFHER
jgi:hypothetical protein